MCCVAAEQGSFPTSRTLVWRLQGSRALSANLRSQTWSAYSRDKQTFLCVHVLTHTLRCPSLVQQLRRAGGSTRTSVLLCEAGSMAAPPSAATGYVSEEDEDFVLDAATAAKDDALERQALGLAPTGDDDEPGHGATLYERRKHARAKYDKAAREANNEVEAAMRRTDAVWRELCAAELEGQSMALGVAGLPTLVFPSKAGVKRRHRKRPRIEDVMLRRVSHDGSLRRKAARVCLAEIVSSRLKIRTIHAVHRHLHRMFRQ